MRHGHISIRTRFLLGISIMLLPLVLLGVGSFYVLSTASAALENMVEETLEELPRITHLKSLLLMAQMPPNDYLISGNPAEQNTFTYFANQIDQALFDLHNAPFGAEQEKSLAGQIGTVWRESVDKANRLFARTDIHASDIDLLMRDFDSTIGKGIDMAERLERAGYHEIEQQVAAASSSRQHMLAILAATGLVGLLIAAGSGLLLARSVLTPLRQLRHGAEKIGRGELNQHLNLSRQDEFGRLAEAFNAMTLNLVRSQSFLKDMAIRDALTGLLNRREFHQRLEGEIDRAHRRQTCLSLVMIDIDHFKRVNDSYGHLTGDEVLRGVAQTIGKETRSMDSLARYGGEEFVIISPETEQGAQVMAERIRQAVGRQFFMGKTERDLQVTVSLGIATLPEQAHTATTLIAKADAALYQAKESGRNRVCCCASEQRCETAEHWPSPLPLIPAQDEH